MSSYKNTPPASISLISIEPKTRAERYLLGAMLREPAGMPDVVGSLNPVALSHASEMLNEVFAEIMKQFTANGTYNVVTIREGGKRQAGEDQNCFDGLSAIAAENTETDLAWAVENWWHEYSIWAELSAMSAAAACGGDALAIKTKQEETRALLGLHGNDRKGRGSESFVQWALDKIDNKEPVYKTAPPLQLQSLRAIVKAFKPGYAWLLSGDTSMGKSQLALQLLSSFADQGAKGKFYSTEMTDDDIYRRLLGIRHGINPEAEWAAGQVQELARSIQEIAALGVEIIDDVFSIAEIESDCAAAYYRGELDYVFIDLLGGVDPLGGGKTQTRERELSLTMKAAVRIAKRYNCAVIGVVHINRENKKRGGSMIPRLSDLKDSGSLEQDAAGVIFTYRPEYYGILEDEDGKSTKGLGEIIVAKQRNGRIETAKVEWSPVRGYRDIQDQSSAFPAAPSANFSRIENGPRTEDEDMPF